MVPWCIENWWIGEVGEVGEVGEDGEVGEVGEVGEIVVFGWLVNFSFSVVVIVLGCFASKIRFYSVFGISKNSVKKKIQLNLNI